MNRFRVAFIPSLPSVALRPVSESSTSQIDWGRVASAVSQEFDVVYDVGGVRVSYYPASITTIFSDLYEEWMLVKRRQSHVMRLSGYPLMDVLFVDSIACFYHSDELHLGDQRKPINGAFAADDVENSLEAAVQLVWSVIKWAESK